MYGGGMHGGGVHGGWGWLAAGLVVAIALAAAALRSRTRPEQPARPPAGPDRPRPTGRGPAAREVWWAEVPFEDGPGAKDRPCLVLRVNGRTATVVKITSKHHAERPGVLALPPGSVGDRQGRTSWLETDELREVPLADFRRRVGPLDEGTWARAQRELR
ncbi:type II toxin-antitoxin system PemK/MazF family toxin [Kitasatospora sp. MAP5-34]|uniref:type II toxin-antitoxin system PemK/MazF family toxin n=1 Tax=Kitasatospora sp. MAP5-34 TaxID=3035102 RepID=UPI002475D338|nr:type II toxin-antitoxin system PemK/MazF family toxin [Kitasatospora sp. MAP5-34]MDH6577124.1 mRNA-degrading endonuclease toxin of MazEF toxin-antitoxin module [Kitasatospora sp. MAP5-34]